MTRYIVRSEVNETNMGFADETNSEDIARLTHRTVPHDSDLIKLMTIFYKYRDVIGYNSIMIISYISIKKLGHEFGYIREIYQKAHPFIYFHLTGTEIPNFLPQIHDDFISKSYKHEFFDYPVAALLTTKDNKILPLDNSFIENIYKIDKSLIRYHSEHKDFSLQYVDVGVIAFICDYFYSAESKTIRSIHVASTMVDFISVNKPSLYHYITESDNFLKCVLPKIMQYVIDNYRDIIADFYDLEIYDKLIKDNSFDDSSIDVEYIHKNNTDRDTKLKRKTELEAELKQLNDEINTLEH